MSEHSQKLTFGGHLEVIRKMLFRIIAVVIILAIIIFCQKINVFAFILAPSTGDFLTYKIIENLLQNYQINFRFEPFQIKLISTELTSQFMLHLSTSVYLAIVCTSPYIVYELFRFTTPALYQHEKKYSLLVVIFMYLLFFLGVALSYLVVFPISLRFLVNYQVTEDIENTITLSSYITSFSVLVFMMGVLFQLPIVVLALTKLNIMTANNLIKYRRHAIIIIMLISAFITPPDIFTLVLVSLPVYLLYEFSILIAKKFQPEQK